MGNRAVITPRVGDTAPVVYLHWNGGLASVKGFLWAARFVIPAGSPEERMDAFAKLVAEYFFDTQVDRLTVYRETYGRSDTDNYDNGVYVIDEDWKIRQRLHNRYGEEIDQEKSIAIAQQIMDRWWRESDYVQPN